MLAKALIVVLGLWGQWLSLQVGGFMRGAHLLYYTNLSNWIMILLSVALLGQEVRVLMARPRGHVPDWLFGLRFASVTGILLTFVVFTLLLAPFLDLWYLASPANLLVHNLVPLLSAADFCLFSTKERPAKPRLSWALLLPGGYLLFSLALAQFGAFFEGGKSRYPYYFLDPGQNGWLALGGGRLGVVYWWLLIALLALLLGKGLLALRYLVQRRAKRTQA